MQLRDYQLIQRIGVHVLYT